MAIDQARSFGASEPRSCRCEDDYHDWKAEPLKLYVDLVPGFIYLWRQLLNSSYLCTCVPVYLST